MRRVIAGTLLTITILSTVAFFAFAVGAGERIIVSAVGVPCWVGWLIVKPRPVVNADT